MEFGMDEGSQNDLVNEFKPYKKPALQEATDRSIPEPNHSHYFLLMDISLQV
jgi:hypothetical protein